MLWNTSNVTNRMSSKIERHCLRAALRYTEPKIQNNTSAVKWFMTRQTFLEQKISLSIPSVTFVPPCSRSTTDTWLVTAQILQKSRRWLNPDFYLHTHSRFSDPELYKMPRTYQWSTPHHQAKNTLTTSTENLHRTKYAFTIPKRDLYDFCRFSGNFW